MVNTIARRHSGERARLRVRARVNERAKTVQNNGVDSSVSDLKLVVQCGAVHCSAALTVRINDLRSPELARCASLSIVRSVIHLHPVRSNDCGV